MIDTKLEAFKLANDPLHLISLLYSKYVDIQEDYLLLISNQLVYNKQSHLNIYFKEQKVFFDKEEYLRRYYNQKESNLRILKLNEYYKNYQSFFCKAVFSDFFFGNLLKNYEDKKAELFYKNNYEDSSLNKEANGKSNNINSTPTLSSLDNVTYNETIFDKNIKQIIENNDKNISISLTLDSFRKNRKGNYGKNNLISTNEKEDSFIKSIKNIVYYKNKNKQKNEKYNEEGAKNKKNNEIDNINKKVNENFKKKIDINNEKIILEKSNKESTNSKNLFSVLNLGNSINTPVNNDNKNISKENKKSSNRNLFLSPKTNQLFYTNINSKITQLKKHMPINIKYLNRNKSHIHENNKTNEQLLINKYLSNPKNNNNVYNKNSQINLEKRKSISTSRLRKISYEKIDRNNVKLHFSKITKYNQFLLNNKNQGKYTKNKTYDLINNGTLIKNLTNQNILFNNYQKLVKSPRLERNKLNNRGFGSKFSLFKGGNLSPEFINSINEQKNRRKFNNFIVSSNSLENNNNIHINSLSPKSIKSNLNINNAKRRYIGKNKVSSNTYIQNNINIINKIKIQQKPNKNNSNYNINFNNLIFYGMNTPANYLENFRNNIINNQNKNLNINKINTNFYMLSFNNYNNNFNESNMKNKSKNNNFNNSSNRKEVIAHNSTNFKNVKNENGKKYKSFKKKRLNLNQNKIPYFTIHKIGHIKKFSSTKSKVKNIKLELIDDKNNFKN